MGKLTALLFIAALAHAPAFPAEKPRSWFSPIRAQAAPGSGLALIADFRVFNNAYTCADSFANVQATLGGRRVTVSYRHIPPVSTRPPCLPSPQDYGPKVRLPALPPGYYEVLEQAWTCAPEEPLCEPPAPVYLGLLAVAEMFGAWDMLPDTVDAGRPFSLQLRNEAYGNCYVGFPDTQVTVARSGYITLTFAVEHYPARLCLADVHPHGPAFAVGGLPAGPYRVQITERPDCTRDSLPCEPVKAEHSVIDTLIVRPSAALRPERAADRRASHRPDLKRGYRLNGRKSPPGG